MAKIRNFLILFPAALSAKFSGCNGRKKADVKLFLFLFCVFSDKKAYICSFFHAVDYEHKK